MEELVFSPGMEHLVETFRQEVGRAVAQARQQQLQDVVRESLARAPSCPHCGGTGEMLAYGSKDQTQVVVRRCRECRATGRDLKQWLLSVGIAGPVQGAGTRREPPPVAKESTCA